MIFDFDSSRAPVTPRDAATVLLLREAPKRFEIFMVKRHGKSGFMAGAHVFPGGTLDPADLEPDMLAHMEGRSPEEAARRLGGEEPRRALALHIAALRETFEEAGVLLADGVDRVDLPRMRRRLHAGESFGALLGELDLRLRADRLIPWGRWVTPAQEKRRYDARFFLAQVPASQHAEHDRIEVTEGTWMTPERALEDFGDGKIQLPPPTLRTLEQLTQVSSLAAALARGESHTPQPVVPHLDISPSGTVVLALPGDPLHPDSEPRIDGPSRFVLTGDRFLSQDPPAD